MNNLKSELRKLYADASKHSLYQNVPDFVSAALGYTESIDEAWRGDRPRLAYLLAHRQPARGETWLDFGANTGFFTLSLAHAFPGTKFVAIEANPNHARFIERVANSFKLCNVEVSIKAVGLRELGALPHTDFMLHLNVLHHAGHDFDTELVPDRSRFATYACEYLAALRAKTNAMLFQMGSNWGGDKQQPLIALRDDLAKLRTFSGWLRTAEWNTQAIAYPRKEGDSRVTYHDIDAPACEALAAGDEAPREACDTALLDAFPGEFYRRALFLCDTAA